jgi:hypothetical protein
LEKIVENKIDLSGLTRYDRILDSMVEKSLGDYYRVADVQALLATVSLQEGELIARNGNVLTCSTCGMSHKLADPYAPSSTQVGASANTPDASAQADELESVYQVQYFAEQGTSAWHDTSEAAYNTFIPERRRILYTGAPAQAAQADLSKDCVRDAALEEAAKVCERFRGLSDQAFRSAKAIRALKSTSADDSRPAVGGEA